MIIVLRFLFPLFGVLQVFYAKDEPLNHPLIKEAVDSDVKRRVMGGQTFQLVACMAGA